MTNYFVVTLQQRSLWSVMFEYDVTSMSYNDIPRPRKARFFEENDSLRALSIRALIAKKKNLLKAFTVSGNTCAPI